jgi:DNA polymerase I - 3''-5'' exonuclease and polymerase domains
MIVTTENAADFIASVQASPLVAIDTETNFTETNHTRFLVGISFCTVDEETWYIPVGHTSPMSLFPAENLEDWRDYFFKALKWVKETVFHNAKFDLTVLENAGGGNDFGFIWDTMIMSHLIDEYPPHALKLLGKNLLGMEEAPELQKQIKGLSKQVGWEGIHPAAMAQYAEQDALLTMRLFKYLKPLLLEEGLKEVYETDIRFMEFLRQIEQTGVLLDREVALHRSQAASLRMDSIRHEIGFEPSRSRLLVDKLYGEPPLGLGLKPSSFTPSGAIQVNEAVLAGINHPLAGLVLEYRGLLKAKSTWYDGFAEKADDQGRLHPNFKQHGTLTGRLSCENPNLQQIPREGSRVKDLFLADPQHELWEFDFSQIELRLAACYAKELDLLEAFKNGADIHQAVADALGISRYAAKTINFATLYGAGVGKLASQLGISTLAAGDYLQNYRATYPRLYAVAQQCAQVATQKGYVEYWDGHRRHFKYPSETHKAFNSVLQGGAFQIVKRAGLNLWSFSYRVVNQVHDSYWINLPTPVQPRHIDDVCAIMSSWTEEMFELEFTVDAKRLS